MDEVKKILIVDDELRIRQTLESLLFKENYDISFAFNGREAIDIIAKVDPDVILMDVMMPEMDGFEACRILKSDEKWRHIPLIMITALDSKKDIVKGLDCGADDFLHKPFNSAELKARIRSLLRIKTLFDDLQANIKMREDLSNMIVHDIRTPLAIIQGTLHMLERNNSESKKNILLKRILGNVKRVNVFLNDILVLSKMKGKDLIIDTYEINICQLIESIVKNHKDIAIARGVTLLYDSSGISSISMPLDRNLFTRVLDNLINNAVKFSERDGTVTIQIDYQDKREGESFEGPGIRIKVIDEGKGIPEENLKKVFQLFESSGTVVGGAMAFGLGLTFCKMVIEKHGGKIFAESNNPKGTVMVIEL